MKDSISGSSASSEPYSSGSDGSSTTLWASRLLRGEYGTRRADESIETESAECHSPSLASMKDVRLASGSTTVSRMVPSPRTAETVGIRRSFFSSSAALFGAGVIMGLQLPQHIERLEEAKMLGLLQKCQRVAVRAATEAMKRSLIWEDCKRRMVVLMKWAEADE